MRKNQVKSVFHLSLITMSDTSICFLYNRQLLLITDIALIVNNFFNSFHIDLERVTDKNHIHFLIVSSN